MAPKKTKKEGTKILNKKTAQEKIPVKEINASKSARGSTSKSTKSTAKSVKKAPAKEGNLAGTKALKKRGKASSKKRGNASQDTSPLAGISVPRDVRINERPKLHSRRRTMAYTPTELEQLLFQRGVTNMNVFNPNAEPVVPVKKVVEKKILLKELPKSTNKRAVGATSIADLLGFNPFDKGSVSPEEKLIPEKWMKHYKKLMARKSELLGTISRHSENAFRKEGKEETGDVSAYSQHTADIDNEAFDREFAISRLASEQEELAEINIAVERMKKGTYGICEITGKPIPAERLNKVPFTRYSIEGKLEAEKQRRVEARRRRANITGDISEIIDIENDAPISLAEEREEP